MPRRGAELRVASRCAPVAAVLLVTASGLAVAADAVSFSADIGPILDQHCATCHVTGTEAGHIALYSAVAYQYLVGVPSEESKLKRVEPGDPDSSYIVHKLNGTHVAVGGIGQQMPFGNPPLPDELQAKIREWIAEGAPNN
jgi:hypothetical protein